MTPSVTRLGPQAPQHPSAAGSLEVPRTLSLAPPVMTGVGALIPSRVHTPPVLPKGPIDAAQDPAGLGQ